MNPEHISYHEYKKRLSKKPHQNFILFVSAFFILLLVFLGLAKIMSPDVDIAIGDEPEVTYEQEGMTRGNVDDRLKRLQDEDNGVGNPADSILETDLDEKVVIPDKKQATEPLQPQEDEPVVLEHSKPEPAPSVQPSEKTTAQTQQKKVEEVKPDNELTTPNAAPVPGPIVSQKTYKVYVGHYASAAQAEVAKGIISESNVGVNAFVKNVNGSYTLQAGSFSSSDKANSVANDLLKNNFPARVVAE